MNCRREKQPDYPVRRIHFRRHLTMGLEQISSVVQTNAATAEESAASSEELSGQASILESLIAQFKLARELYEPSEPAVASESPAEPSSMYEKY